MDSNQGYNLYKWVICPLTRVINLPTFNQLITKYPEPLSRTYIVAGPTLQEVTHCFVCLVSQRWFVTEVCEKDLGGWMIHDAWNDFGS